MLIRAACRKCISLGAPYTSGTQQLCLVCVCVWGGGGGGGTRFIRPYAGNRGVRRCRERGEGGLTVSAIDILDFT